MRSLIAICIEVMPLCLSASAAFIPPSPKATTRTRTIKIARDDRNENWDNLNPGYDDWRDGPVMGNGQGFYEDEFYYDPSFGPQQGYQQYQDGFRDAPSSSYDFRHQDQFDDQPFSPDQEQMGRPPYMQYDPNLDERNYQQNGFNGMPPPGNYYNNENHGEYRRQYSGDFRQPEYQYQQENNYQYNGPRPPLYPQQVENGNSYDWRQPPRYEEERPDNYFNNMYQYDRMQPQSGPIPPYRPGDPQQQRPPPITELLRNENPYEYYPNYVNRNKIMPRAIPGNGILDMMGEMMIRTRIMMDQFSSQMESAMINARGDQPLDEARMMNDALDYLVSDPEVSNVLGGSVQLGLPFSRSSSSAMIDGVSKSRLQLGIPIRGSRGEGQVRLLADDRGIMRLEVGANGRVIDVNLGSSRRSNSQKKEANVIDARVVDKKVL